MDEDFFVKFSGASRYEDGGKIHFRMVEPHERVAALPPLLRELIQSETQPGEIHQCPLCGQDLKVSFSRFIGSPYLGITTFCKTCNIFVSFDSSKIPTWVPKPKSFWEALDELRIPGDENA